MDHQKRSPDASWVTNLRQTGPGTRDRLELELLLASTLGTQTKLASDLLLDLDTLADLLGLHMVLQAWSYVWRSCPHHYTPKKGKVAFAPRKTSFVINNGRFCTSCKQVGHIEQKCMNKKSQANVSSIKFDSFYVLTKGTNGVKAKLIGKPWMGSKKKAIWVPKSSVTNLQGPK